MPWDRVLHVGLVQLHCVRGFPCAEAPFISKAEAGWLDVYLQAASTKTPPTPSFNVYNVSVSDQSGNTVSLSKLAYFPHLALLVS